MTLNELVKRPNQIVVDNSQAAELPVHETYYVSRGKYSRQYNAYHEVRSVQVGKAEVFVKQGKGAYRPEMRPVVLLIAKYDTA